MTDTHSSQSDAVEASRAHSRLAVIVDLPNINSQLRLLAGSCSTPKPRLGFEAITAFAVAEGAGVDELSCTVFMRVPERAETVRGFVTRLRHMGIGVWARPDGDIDDCMVAHVERMQSLDHLMIATHDRQLIRRCVAAAGPAATITVLGFEEFALAAIRDERIRFVDLGELPGALPATLVRSVFGNLPPEGALLAPVGELLRPNRPNLSVA